MREHIDRLGILAGDTLCVHSRMLSFGMLEGGAAMVTDVLLQAVGSEGTLIVPTYTIDAADTPFDPATTPSRNVGALSEYVRNLPGAVRSASPMHSHAAVGAQASYLLNSDPAVSFGPRSDFAQFHTLSAKLVLLGCDFQQGGTYLHQMEVLSSVPYREWVTVSRRVAGMPQPLACQYYGRKLEQPVHNDFSEFQKIAINQGIVTKVAAPYGRSHAVALHDLHRLAKQMLKNDPFALVKYD